jgi:hypothetical protein
VKGLNDIAVVNNNMKATSAELTSSLYCVTWTVVVLNVMQLAERPGGAQGGPDSDLASVVPRSIGLRAQADDKACSGQPPSLGPTYQGKNSCKKQHKFDGEANSDSRTISVVR